MEDAHEYKNRITVAIIALAFILLLAVGLFSVQISRNTLIDRSQEFLKAILHGSEFEINQKLQASEKVVTSLDSELSLTYNAKKDLTDPSYRQKYLEKFKSSLNVAADLSPAKTAFLILVEDDQVEVLMFTDVNGDSIPEEVLSTDIWNDINSTKLQSDHSNGYWSFLIDEQAIYYSKSIKLSEDVLAVIGSGASYNDLISTVNATHIMDSGVMFLLDSKGDTIFTPETVKLSNLLETEFIDTSEVLSFFQVFNERNEPILVGTKSLVNGWILGIAVNEDEITSGLDYIILLLAGMMVIAMMLTIVFSSLIAKMLSRPITYIAQKN